MDDNKKGASRSWDSLFRIDSKGKKLVFDAVENKWIEPKTAEPNLTWASEAEEYAEDVPDIRNSNGAKNFDGCGMPKVTKIPAPREHSLDELCTLSGVSKKADTLQQELDFVEQLCQ